MLMSVMMISPVCDGPSFIENPFFLTAKVTVFVALMAAPNTSPVFASSPDGISADIIGLHKSFAVLIRVLNGSLTSPESPVPNSASMTTS